MYSLLIAKIHKDADQFEPDIQRSCAFAQYGPNFVIKNTILMSMKLWIRIAIAALIVTGLFLIGYILSEGSDTPKQPMDIGIVMGTKVEADGKPSEKLLYRLDKSIELFQTGQVNELWMTGGKGISGLNEAVVMKSYLVDQGVPREAIKVDSLGISTFASARNLADQLPQEASVMIISHTSHLRRTKYAFENFGRKIDEVIGVSGGFGSLGSEAFGVLRECLALPYYWSRSYE